jgi:nucleotide-binding universal stress UspA family protein
MSQGGWVEFTLDDEGNYPFAMSEKALLICYDGSDDSKQAIAHAGQLFPRRAAIVLHVWEPLKEVASVPHVPGLHGTLEAGLTEMDQIGEDISRQTAEDGAKLATSAGLDAEPSSVRAPGRAWRNILRLARERDVDAIVIGQRGLGGAERALLGSVSTAVVHHADRPVLLVPFSGRG